MISGSDLKVFFGVLLLIYFIYILIVGEIFKSSNGLKTTKSWIVTLFIKAIPLLAVFFWLFSNTWVYLVSFIVAVPTLSYLLDGTKTRIGRIITALIVIIPVTWTLVDIRLSQSQRHKKNIVREEKFKQLCAQESSFKIKRKIPKESIVTIEPLEALNWRVNDNYKSCAQKFERYGPEWHDCSERFSFGIRWKKYNIEGYAEQYGKANIETETQSLANVIGKGKKLSGDFKDKPIYQISAPKHWWLRAGIGEIVGQIKHFDSAEYDKRFSLSMLKPLSSYHIETREISKISDREDGARRFKISLTDKSNGEVIAEYIGFDSSKKSRPGPMSHGYEAPLSEINCVTLALGEPLHHLNKSDYHGDHPPEEKVFKYFFEQVVDDEQTQPTPRIYHYP